MRFSHDTVPLYNRGSGGDDNVPFVEVFLKNHIKTLLLHFSLYYILKRESSLLMSETYNWPGEYFNFFPLDVSCFVCSVCLLGNSSSHGLRYVGA